MAKQHKGQSFIQTLESNIRSILSVGAIIYAWGFIVASVYLSQYHVVSLNLLRIQYILAGMWIVIPIIFFAVASFWLAAGIDMQFFDTDDDQVYKGTKRFWRILKGWLVIFLSLFGCYGVFSIFLIWSSPQVIDQFTPIGFLDILKTIGFCLGITVPIAVNWLASSVLGDKSGKINFRQIITPVLSFSVTGMMLVGYTLYFATSIYPKIPSVFGGGQPIEVRFILVHDSDYEASRDLLHFIDDEELSPTLELVTTTEND